MYTVINRPKGLNPETQHTQSFPLVSINAKGRTVIDVGISSSGPILVLYCTIILKIKNIY